MPQSLGRTIGSTRSASGGTIVLTTTGVRMRVRQTAGPAEFLEATQALRAADPVRTNILGSIALSVLDGRAYERAVLVRRRGRRRRRSSAPRAGLCRTSSSSDRGRPRSCGRSVRRRSRPVSRCTARSCRSSWPTTSPRASVGAGCRTWASGSSPSRTTSLRTPSPARCAPSPRPTSTLVERWIDEFTAEAGVLVVDNRAAAARQHRSAVVLGGRRRPGVDGRARLRRGDPRVPPSPGSGRSTRRRRTATAATAAR